MDRSPAPAFKQENFIFIHEDAVTLLLGVPVFRKYGLLARLIKSVLAGTMVPDRIVVVDNGGAFDTAYHGPLDRVEVIRPATNEGCAAGWNRILAAASAAGDEIILANDDIVLRPDGVEMMIRQLRADGGASVVRGHGFSLFCLSQQTWRRVGSFDERFWPAYLEDSDYKYRLSLAGVPMPPKLVAAAAHASSATIQAFSWSERLRFRFRYALNRIYYRLKWGGWPGNERRSTPFIPWGKRRRLILEERYTLACQTVSDIHEHLPVLRDLASQVEHVTEFGVRHGVSTTALLAAQPAVLRSYDIYHRISADRLAPLAGRTAFTFTVGDTKAIDIEETDLLFIDTLHTYDQLAAELARHGAKARRWIVLHDTTTFATRGQESDPRGLWPAVEEFLVRGPFSLKERRTNNNGLTILERIVPLQAMGPNP